MSSYWPPIIPSVAWASSRATVRRRVRERELERLGEQRVAVQDRRRLVVLHVRGRARRGGRRRRRARAGRRGPSPKVCTSSTAAAAGRSSLRLRPERLAGREAEHGPHPLAAAVEAVAHRVGQRAELARERKLREVGLDALAVLVEATAPALAPGLLELGLDLLRDLARARRGCRSPRPGRRPPRAARASARAVEQLLGRLERVLGRAHATRSRAMRPRIPFTSRPASSEA